MHKWIHGYGISSEVKTKHHDPKIKLLYLIYVKWSMHVLVFLLNVCDITRKLESSQVFLLVFVLSEIENIGLFSLRWIDLLTRDQSTYQLHGSYSNQARGFMYTAVVSANYISWLNKPVWLIWHSTLFTIALLFKNRNAATVIVKTIWKYWLSVM